MQHISIFCRPEGGRRSCRRRIPCLRGAVGQQQQAGCPLPGAVAAIVVVVVVVAIAAIVVAVVIVIVDSSNKQDVLYQVLLLLLLLSNILKPNLILQREWRMVAQALSVPRYDFAMAHIPTSRSQIFFFRFF